MENSILLIAFSLLLIITEVKMANQPNTPDCPKIYQRFSTSHSYCQPRNFSCNIVESNVAEEERNKILDLHNSHRSTIATQGEGSRDLPPASDMLFMEWDDELAAVAQSHTNKCVYEHDKGNERRVRNFGVGQNIAEQDLSGYDVEQPEPDWAWAIDSFYSEIETFESDMICGSRDLPPGHRAIGHFTQVVWSKSFRVGCGYTLFKEGNTYTRYYACNYGPGGNVAGECVYKEGPACSNCPANTECTEDSDYPGLCQRTNDQAPYQPVKAPTLFDCNFINYDSEDCRINPVGDGPWYYTPALGGTYLETVLQPGQNGTVIFDKSIIGSSKSICVIITYRKGPELAKNPQNNKAKALLVTPSSDDYTAVYDLPDVNKPYRQQFVQDRPSVEWKDETKLKISFAVPRRATPQFFNLKSVVAFNDECQDIEGY